MRIKHSKQEIIEKGIVLMCTGGYHQTGIASILKACNIPKGSFYNFFSSKEHFTLEAIDLYANQLFDFLGTLKENTEMAGIQKVNAYFLHVSETYKKNHFKTSCLLANLSLEMGNHHPEITRAVFAVRQEIQKRLTFFLKTDNQEDNHQSEKKITLLLDAFYGVLTRMRTTTTQQPLDDFFQYHLPVILQPQKNNV